VDKAFKNINAATMSTATKPSHIGRKISRIRELRGMKQEALAQALGVSQQTVSNIENSEEVEEKTLVKVAEALGVSTEAIKNFSDEAVISFITNFYDNSTGPAVNFQCTFNPLDKVVELYERLVQAEKEKVEYLEKLLNK
jgi:transcriptional regulator with XRE-family HTH domain